MTYNESCPACGSETFNLVIIESDDQIRVDCCECGNVVAVGNDPSIDSRIHAD